MMNSAATLATSPASVSELILSDRLIALAQDADRAGFTDTAERLVNLACTVFDEAPKKPH